MRPRSRKPASFVERHGLWSDTQAKTAAQIERIVKKEKLEVVRFSFADQHGVLRGKTLVAAEVAGAMCAGVTMTRRCSRKTRLTVLSIRCSRRAAVSP